MKLNVFERLILLGVLPAEGNLRTMRIVAQLRTDLGFTAAELADWNIDEDGAGRVTWGWSDAEKAKDPKKAEQDMTADIDVEGEKTAVIVDTLKKLDDAGKVTAQHMPLFEKFPLLKVQKDG